MFIITKEEIEHMTEFQLRELYHGIITDLAKRGLSAQDCPLTMIMNIINPSCDVVHRRATDNNIKLRAVCIAMPMAP